MTYELTDEQIGDMVFNGETVPSINTVTEGRNTILKTWAQAVVDKRATNSDSDVKQQVFKFAYEEFLSGAPFPNKEIISKIINNQGYVAIMTKKWDDHYDDSFEPSGD
jgi:hypothetical protein